MQGDITGFLDSSGNQMVTYTYDAWGNVTDVSGILTWLGYTNGLRYRGYYYDNETNSYYLQSRYYNPQLCRFINADDGRFIGVSGTLLSKNAFAYCENNPTMNVDSTGKFSIPRALIVFGIDAVIWAVFSAGAATFAFLTQPVKAMARYAGKALIKLKMKGILKGFLNTLAKAIVKVSKFLVPIVKKTVGWAFKKWAAKLSVVKLSETIAGGLISVTANSFLNAIAKNITVFLSFGGIIGGLWDWYSDGKLDGWIKLW